jgi:glycosyltransferase involved in cell wall biosynthesis
MNILLSAYGCSPILGSEPGVGWHWASELAKRFTVTLLTHPFFLESIEAELRKNPMPSLTVVYYEPRWLGVRRKRGSLNSRFYYMAWQLGAMLKARALCSSNKFILVHHITWGTFRFSSFMGFLGIPFVMGPVGGGEKSPLRLLKTMPLKEQFREIFRNVFIAAVNIDPIVRLCLAKTDIILCKTDESAKALPIGRGPKVMITQEIGAPACMRRQKKLGTVGSISLLYAGRLVGLKGVHFAIRAVALANARGVAATLTIIGDGPLEQYLKALTASLGLSEKVFFNGFLPQQELLDCYQESEVFIFPSLHDSSGNVVLEALSRGLPVICLDLGGPKYFVNPACARVIPSADVSVDQLCRLLADRIVEMATDPNLRADMSEAAFAKAKTLGWESQVFRAYDLISSAGIFK